MYCSYHPSNVSRVRCTNCSRALCVYCDHRIKGYPYCQDCIVLGIECLSRRSSCEEQSKRSARLAALCALMPGMGAVYNRQNLKAIVHFIAIVGLLQLSGVRVLASFFALAGMSFYFYSIIDAYRTARAISQGESPTLGEQRLKRSLIKLAPTIGIILIVAGLFHLIQLVRPFGFSVSAIRFIPVGLILLGGYLIVTYLKRSRGGDYIDWYPPKVPYPLIPSQRNTTEGLSRSDCTQERR
jgi:hypothetical protein